MDNTSYLFMSRRKKLKFSYRKMDKDSSTDSNLSLDSLEKSFKQNTKITKKESEDNVDTILVPFYEKDVLIKVPKDSKRNVNNAGKAYKSCEMVKRNTQQVNSYLVNKNKQKSNRVSYLEMFRKQFTPECVENKPDKSEIRSLSPEFGDTERESIEDDITESPKEFYNTEAYNEMYYEKLLNRDIQIYMDNSLEEGLQFSENINLESPPGERDISHDNLKSVSEVSNPRRAPTRANRIPHQMVKLGGLGPDMEKIKPRLERARSLQRYSEKVRMENRLKIYKNTYQAANEKKDRDLSNKRPIPEPCHIVNQCQVDVSYLVNKSLNEKNAIVRSSHIKSQSADAQKTREKNLESRKLQSASKKREALKNESKKKLEKTETDEKNLEKPYLKGSISKNKGINTDDQEIAPVHISFMVNLGGVRPSTALKTLEEKHRMYQEQVREFIDNNDG